MVMEKGNMYCSEIKYVGHYEIKGLLPYNIKRNWSLRRNNVKYDIEIITVLNQKVITIKSSKPVLLDKVFEMLCKILRYECLFDGRFFRMKELEADGTDVKEDVGSGMLSYYSGVKSYTLFNQPMNDRVYKRGFCAWERFDKKALNINQMFYYIGFIEGITSDLRLALFSEIFEPLSELLEADNRMQIINSQPIIEKKTECPKCGEKYSNFITSKPSFRDRIESVIQIYGTKIFENDDIDTILKKTVNTRNKMLHVDADKKNIMTGGQCGFYIRKYVELYRIVVFSELKLWNSGMEKELVAAINFYNSDFPKLRIKKKRFNEKQTTQQNAGK